MFGKGKIKELENQLTAMKQKLESAVREKTDLDAQLKSAKDNAFYAEKLANADGFDNIAFLSAKVCLEQADAYYVSPAFNGSSTARDEVAALLPACLTIPDGVDVDAEIQKLFEKAIEACNYSL